MRLALSLFALLAAVPRPARAIVLYEDALEERSLELGLMLRAFSFVLSGPTLRPPYAMEDADPAGLGLSDLRLLASYRSPRLKMVLHNQLTLSVRSQAQVGGLGLGRGTEPRRFFPLQADLADEGTFAVREVLDWAYLAVTLGPVTLSAGRQPVTFGRGKLWQATDLLATFALTEVDTEYKPGTDALRLDVTASQRTTLTVVAAAGRDLATDELDLRGSAFAARLKQGWPSGEAGLLAGYIRHDVVLGLDAVWDAGPFDLYGEVTVTLVSAESLTPREPEVDPAVVRAVLGATFRPWPKLTLSPEVYFNGFGAWEPAEYLAVALSERVSAGEMYTLGRLYLGTVALWEAHPLLQVRAAAIANLRDPSGLVFLGLSYNVASSVEALVGGYLPVGRLPDVRGEPLFPTPRHEFGLYPTFVFLEIKAAM